MAAAGDVNGDGYGDLAVGSPYYDNGHSDEGRVWVYHGSSMGVTVLAWTAEADQATPTSDGVWTERAMSTATATTT